MNDGSDLRKTRPAYVVALDRYRKARRRGALLLFLGVALPLLIYPFAQR